MSRTAATRSRGGEGEGSPTVRTDAAAEMAPMVDHASSAFSALVASRARQSSSRLPPLLVPPPPPARRGHDPTFRGMPATPIPAVIRRRHVFILNLFCGARRPHDIQDSLQQAVSARNFPLPDVEIWVLAIGVVVDPIEGDLTRELSPVHPVKRYLGGEYLGRRGRVGRRRGRGGCGCLVWCNRESHLT